MRINALLFVMVAWASSSCGGSQRAKDRHSEATDTRHEVRIWIQEDPRMPKAVVMRGCEAWKTKNVICRQVATEAEGQVRVYASEEACVILDLKTRQISTTLAWAFAGGKIKVMAKCLDKVEGAFDLRELGAVITHEVGHQLGIWEHVSKSCAEKDIPTHRASGRKICGTAVMNPYYDPDVFAVTEIDALAFDDRDRSYSVLVSDTPDKSICTYRRAPVP